MDAERNESALKTTRGERQRGGGAGALQVARGRIFVAVADVEHRGGLVDADDAACRLQASRNRPGYAAGSGSDIENALIPAEREDIGELLGQIGADLRGAAVELGGMLGIV